MSIRAMRDYTYSAKYAKWLPEKKRREVFGESVDRVKNMMLSQYKDQIDQDPKLLEYIDYAYDMMRKKKVLGSQRALQFGGDPILKKNLRIYNCLTSFIDRPEFFQECMYALLCGCGVGFSVQKHHVEQLPILVSIRGEKKTFVIEDSVEGWSDSIGVLVCSYFRDSEIWQAYAGKSVSFDYTKIRDENAPISSGGKAPGAEPLKEAHRKIRSILDNAIENGEFAAIEFKKLKPIEVYDIVMHFADAVLAGGVRRSATIAIFSKDDEEMIKAKTGNWLSENPQRGRSNNSALLLRDETTKEEFMKFIESVKQYGEPGFVWADSTEIGFNPCLEVGMYPVDIETGKSGWQGCNLSTINTSKIKKEEDLMDAVRAAAIIGTLQAGFTDFSYFDETSENIFKREALLGISMTGIMETPDICLDPKTQKKAANYAKEVNKEIAGMIGINQAARLTVIKPEGTTSCMLGTSSGIHPHHAKRYIRRIQANKNEPIYQHFQSINPSACEESVWGKGRSDQINFCIEVPDGSKTKNQISALDFLDIIKSTQKNWVLAGMNKELCVKPYLEHNVSNTVNVKEDEWDEVSKYIYKNRKYFCGISLLAATGDKDYPQAPFTTVYLPSEQVSYYGDGIMFVSGLIDKALDLWEDNLWQACDDLLGLGKQIRGDSKREWKNRCEKYANNYFNGDIRRLTYAMKDVYNYKLWTELNREYKSVDYTKAIEEEDNTDFKLEAACSGGTCEII
jgi:ribonucleoside-diphosphate reductase alpha chain